jgi:hypothetical protein
MTKVEIDIHDAQILCGAVCDLLYLNEKTYRHFRLDHERIEAAKDRLAAAIQKEEDEETK